MREMVSGGFTLWLLTVKLGLESLHSLEQKHGKLPATMVVKTPNGGYHYYFRYPANGLIKNSTSTIAPDIDIRGDGGCIIWPGSIRPNGKYEIVSGGIPGKSTLVVTCENPTTLRFLAALINSKLAIFYISEKYASSSYNGGIGFTKDMINDIPIPDKADQVWFASKVDEVMTTQKALYELSSKFLALLSAELTIIDFSGKLAQWYTLTFAEFTAELAKKKVALTVSQKAEWMEHFEKQKAIASAIKTTIDTTDHEIDQMVYALYGLTPDEIAIVEAA